MLRPLRYPAHAGTRSKRTLTANTCRNTSASSRLSPARAAGRNRDIRRGERVTRLTGITPLQWFVLLVLLSMAVTSIVVAGGR